MAAITCKDILQNKKYLDLFYQRFKLNSTLKI